jgi:hypothetical protein
MPRCSACGATFSDEEQVCPDCGTESALRETFVITRGPSGSKVARPTLPPASTPPAESGAAMATLTLRRTGALTSERFPLGRRAIIGRSDATAGPVDVDLGPLPESMYLSRHHAEVWQDDRGEWSIRDLGSQNGTFVRPAAAAQFQRVAEGSAIHDGDEIAFGNARFEFHTG